MYVNVSMFILSYCLVRRWIIAVDIEVDDCGYDDGEMTRSSNKTISIENHGVVYFLEGVIVYFQTTYQLAPTSTHTHTHTHTRSH